MNEFEKALNMLQHMVSTSIPAPQMRRMVREALVVLEKESRLQRAVNMRNQTGIKGS